MLQFFFSFISDISILILRYEKCFMSMWSQLQSYLLGQQIEGHRLIRKAGDVIGLKLDSLESVMERQMLQKLRSEKYHQLPSPAPGPTKKRTDQETQSTHPKGQRATGLSFPWQLNSTVSPYKKHYVPHTSHLFIQ